ncbi:MAG: hypothetical protein AAF734_01550, partial [Bacteroidota bacterium]
FGWTIRSQKVLKSYFKEWLFPKYPKLDTSRLEIISKVEFVNSKTAWVDVQQHIFSEDMKTIANTYRQTHLVVKSGNSWLIKKTRMWKPSSHDNPPRAFLSSESFFE